MVRAAVVSGQFYPQKKQDINIMIEGFGQKPHSRFAAKGLILPHAGYVYSGKVAVAVVSSVLPQKRVIILGNNHTGNGENFSLWAKGAWHIPLGKISIDEELAALILEKGGGIKEDYSAHQFEHSIEVQLPILSYFFGEFKFAPVVCQTARLEDYLKVSQALFSAVKDLGEDVLFIASSDMTHYEADACVRRKDRLAIEKIISLDETALLEVVERENISMCGVAPVVIMLVCVKKLGARKACVVLYQTSGDVNKEYDSVVGYAGIVIK